MTPARASRPRVEASTLRGRFSAELASDTAVFRKSQVCGYRRSWLRPAAMQGKSGGLAVLARFRRQALPFWRLSRSASVRIARSESDRRRPGIGQKLEIDCHDSHRAGSALKSQDVKEPRLQRAKTSKSQDFKEPILQRVKTSKSQDFWNYSDFGPGVNPRPRAWRLSGSNWQHRGDYRRTISRHAQARDTLSPTKH